MEKISILGTLIYITNRFKEPGSMRTIMFLAGIFQVPAVQVDNWMGVVTLIMGAAAVFTPEIQPVQKVTGFNK